MSGSKPSTMDQAQGMAQLIMDDWKRFFRNHGVPVQGVCRAVRSALAPQPEAKPTEPVGQAPTDVERLSARVAELEAELARLKAEPTGE